METTVQELRPLRHKEEARKQFDYWTKMLNLKHTFTFDEMWEFLVHKRKQKFRTDITAFERKIHELPEDPRVLVERENIDRVNPLKHTFTDGVCIREIFNPKGELIVTKIHKREHPFFLLKGEMSIVTDEGLRRIKAPYYGVTPVGTKRLIYTHDDCVFVTIHVTRETDINKIEEEFFTEDFKALKEEV